MKRNEKKDISIEKGPLGRNFMDPLGSYTGGPADPLEQPVQDADDL